MDLVSWAIRTSPKFTTGVKISVPSEFLTRSDIRKLQSPFAPVIGIVFQYIENYHTCDDSVHNVE